MCDTLGFVKNGISYFAKNSDRSPNEPQVLEFCPRRKAEGTRKLLYTQIPDADARSVLISRPTWMWGAEMGINESGLAIGNEAVFTWGPYGKSGLTGMELVRLALERADTARQAVTVITGLLEEHGQGGNCGFDHEFYYDNAFLIQDRTESLVLETSGRHWVVKSGSRQAISNRLSIGTDWDDGDAATPKGTDFRRKHLEPLYSTFSGSAGRRKQSCRNLNTSETVSDLMQSLRTHAPGFPGGMCSGSVGSVCMHAGGIVGDHTTASLVAEIGETTVIWATGTSLPCLSAFKPWVFGNELCSPVFAPNDPAAKAYWLEAERFRRSLIGKVIPQEYYAQRDAMEADWIQEAKGLDAISMAELSRKALRQEAAFFAHWKAQNLPNGKMAPGFGAYWKKKNAALE